MDFKGKYVVLTGASGKIGRCLADEFAKRGADLLLIDHPEAKENINLAKRLNDQYSGNIRSCAIDIRNPTYIKESLAELQPDISRVDILVNNAGTNSFSSALQITEENWDQIIDVNLKGAFFMAQEVASWMVPQKSGVIVNIASQHGVVGNKNRAPYCASKAGLINLSRALASEWAGYQIRVNAVSPTFVHDVDDELNHAYLTSSKVKREYLSQIPLRKYATPLDVANAVLYLSSDMAGMVTGHNLVVDGGWTAI
jgi:NAD(P)-dependent dehydrogenase (short-subunit alcohol dehydrogenase family)